MIVCVQKHDVCVVRCNMVISHGFAFILWHLCATTTLAIGMWAQAYNRSRCDDRVDNIPPSCMLVLHCWLNIVFMCTLLPVMSNNGSGQHARQQPSKLSQSVKQRPVVCFHTGSLSGHDTQKYSLRQQGAYTRN